MAEQQYVVFRLEGQEYGAPVDVVREVVGPLPITPLPNTPGFVLGVVSLRGDVFPVIDMRLRLRLPPRSHDDETRILILDLTGHRAGVVVDGVAEVVKFREEEIVPPDCQFTAPGQDYIRGIARAGDRLVVIMDLADLILSQAAA